MATELHRLVDPIVGVDAGSKPQVNSLFPRVRPDIIEPLREWCFFWDWDPAVHQVRWMTSWDTTLDDVTAFADGVAALVNAG